MSTDSVEDPIARIAGQVSSITGVQLGERQRAMVDSRLSHRILELGLGSVVEYAAYFDENFDEEIGVLVSLLTTHHSYFFRESSQFSFLCETALPQLVKAARERGRKCLRFWSAACSRGQEVYTLAMVLEDALSRLAPDITFEVLGTDIDTESVRHATNGVYHVADMKSVPKSFLERFWVRGSGAISEYFRLKGTLRSKVRFEVRNLVDLRGHPDKEGFDAIFCRNVFIYFTADQSERSARELVERITPGGFLFLGLSESIAGPTLGAKAVEPATYQKAEKIQASVAAPPERQKARVLIVDDSATIRTLLRIVLSEDPEIEVVGAAAHHREVEELINRHKPNVMTLDLRMPEMDGVAMLKKFYPKYRIPAVIVSAYAAQEGPLVLSALEAGAVDFIQKPSWEAIGPLGALVREKVKAAAASNATAAPGPATGEASRETRFTPRFGEADLDMVVAIGASTGGPEALRMILPRLPERIPPILVVQHIPPFFSKALADRLNGLSACHIKEAEHQEPLEAGKVLVAPGGCQMRVAMKDRKRVVLLDDATPVGGHCPSVDVLFNSVAEQVGAKSIGILLTGMGRDGASGLQKMKQAGARTIAQNAATSVVYGMPRAAIEMGCVDEVAAVEDVPAILMTWLARRAKNAA